MEEPAPPPGDEGAAAVEGGELFPVDEEEFTAAVGDAFEDVWAIDVEGAAVTICCCANCM